MVSNRQRASAMAILRNLGVAEIFDHVEAPLDKTEPGTKPIEKILAKYNIGKHRERAVFIGDSNMDIGSANDHNLVTIAVTTGMGSKRVLAIDHPTAIVDDLLEASELLNHIEPFRKTIYQEHMRRLKTYSGEKPHENEETTTKTYDPEKVYLLNIHKDSVSLGDLIDHEEAEKQGLPQACVYIVLLNSKNEIYVQHRSSKKNLWPNLKTVSASGHVDPGETFEKALLRELKEELNISIKAKDHKEIGFFVGTSHCGVVFEVNTDQIPKPNPNELDVEKSGFLQISELTLMLKCSCLFTPSGMKALEVWNKYRNDG